MYQLPVSTENHLHPNILMSTKSLIRSSSGPKSKRRKTSHLLISWYSSGNNYMKFKFLRLGIKAVGNLSLAPYVTLNTFNLRKLNRSNSLTDIRCSSLMQCVLSCVYLAFV